MTPLDSRDLAILQILTQEGRITKAALAELVGLSPTPCWERLRRLEKAGFGPRAHDRCHGVRLWRWAGITRQQFKRWQL